MNDLVLAEVVHPVHDVLSVAEELVGVLDGVPVDDQVLVEAALPDEWCWPCPPSLL